MANAICQARDLDGHLGLFRTYGGHALYDEVRVEGAKVRLIRHRGRSALDKATTAVEVLRIDK